MDETPTLVGGTKNIRAKTDKIYNIIKSITF